MRDFGSYARSFLCLLGSGFLAILNPVQPICVCLLMEFRGHWPALLDATMAFLSQPTVGSFGF